MSRGFASGSTRAGNPFRPMCPISRPSLEFTPLTSLDTIALPFSFGSDSTFNSLGSSLCYRMSRLYDPAVTSRPILHTSVPGRSGTFPEDLFGIA